MPSTAISRVDVLGVRVSAVSMAQALDASLADAVAHGATGKGNDQVRFEVALRTLAPDDFDADDERYFAFTPPRVARTLLVESTEEPAAPTAAPTSSAANCLPARWASWPSTARHQDSTHE